MIKLAPSILSADFARLLEDVKKVENAGCEYLHIDVMDGHFVPNITLGPNVVKSLRKDVDMVFDAHLMIENPDQYIKEFVDAGCDIIVVHQEACRHLHRTIQNIKSYGIKAGVSLNPATPIETIKHIIRDVDMVLIMTVNPGFGGQSFIESMLEKIKELKQLAKDISLSFNDLLKTDLDNRTTDDIFNIIFEQLEDKITIIFPQLTVEDIENAYISEVEELLKAFIEVNFIGAKKVISQVMKLA